MALGALGFVSVCSGPLREGRDRNEGGQQDDGRSFDSLHHDVAP
jgi:hypothetical protein